MTFIELAATDPDPAVTVDGIALVPRADREAHAPDRHLVMVDRGLLTARCSCWWSAAPHLPGERLGVIGHYAAADAASGAALLDRACEVLSAAGCTTAVGPMDGNTWRRYRFVVNRGSEPMFFLEPDNPDGWPGHWADAGFSPLARYTSAVNDDLTVADPRTGAALARLAHAGISIRTFDPDRADRELQRIFALSLASFSQNFLYSAISEAEFRAQSRALLPILRPDLILLAEQDGDLVGFAFALPDLLQAHPGRAVDTIIIKTVAVDVRRPARGLGSVLVDRVQQAARRTGFRRAIHALMHETNVSRNISGRYGRTMRHYALFARPL